MDEDTLQGAVARGSFGKVFVAVDLDTQTTVAIKRQQLPSDAASRELCWYRALSQATHPNVMHLLNNFILTSKDGGQRYLYMVFDFMDTTLWSIWVRHRRVLPHAQAVMYINDLVSGVAHLHAQGIAHADLSMKNMLIGLGAKLRIADLGGAANAGDMVLAPDDVITTLCARAPEVILGCSRPTESIDLWAVGVTSMALLTGSLVFSRPKGLELRVPGLLGEKSPLPSTFGNVQGVEHEALTALANQVAFLGPISAEVWPGCTALPGVAKWATLVKKPPLCATPAEFLADAGLVRRPVAATESGSAFVRDLLIWDPAKRLRAKDCVDHAFLRNPNVVPSVAHTLVTGMTNRQLQEVVLDSLVSGRPVTMDALCGTRDASAHPRSIANVSPNTGSQDGSCIPLMQAQTQASASSQGGAEIHSSSHAAAHTLASAGVARRVRITGKRPREASGVSSQAMPTQGPVQAASTLARRDTQCTCSGNCGQRACKRRKNAYVRHGGDASFCVLPAVPEQSYCVFCKCECCGHPRQSAHGSGRWCTACAQRFSQASSQVVYHNQHGSFRVDKAWSEPLALTARFAYATNPGASIDNGAWTEFLNAFLAWREVGSLSMLEEPGDWLFVCLVACVHWPRVVCEAFSLLQGLEPRTATADQWHAYLVRLLEFAHGKCWSDMHRALIPGRGRCCFGLVWFCKLLGVIVKSAEREKSRGEALHLGASQAAYELGDAASSQAKILHIMNSIPRKPLVFPTSMVWSQVKEFGRSVHDISSVFVGSSSDLGKHYLCRKMLSCLEREHGREVWDAGLMSELQAWLPDMRDHCRPLYDYNCGDVRRRFGMCPLLVSAMACNWGAVAEKYLPGLKASSPIDVLNAVAEAAANLASSQAVQWPNNLRSAPLSGVPSTQWLFVSDSWPAPSQWVTLLRKALKLI